MFTLDSALYCHTCTRDQKYQSILRKYIGINIGVFCIFTKRTENV